MSRIGKMPIEIPKGVKFEIKEGEITVTGPKGTLKRPLLEGLNVQADGSVINVQRVNDEKKIMSYHGLMRTLIANMVDGVHNGFERKLEIIGIGYRAELQGNNVVFYLGYSHPIVFALPQGISAQVDKQTSVTVRGIDKELLGEVAANPDHVHATRGS